MHPFVRDLYKRAILVGRDYPHKDGLDYVRKTWKKALRDPSNCPLYYNSSDRAKDEKDIEREILKAVGRGRYMVKEMAGIIQLKKYREMKKRYGSNDGADKLEEALRLLSENAENGPKTGG
mmetsp:Transcript_54388/g.80695  ORF Transcript_54388/g.80695 Transcript_54388/m.80695 type:complete len:121 (-) Transcript_54388:343-705(-)